MRPTLLGIRTRVRSAVGVDRADLEHTVLLAGSARSGTTWLEEVVDHDSDYRVVFEPFHVRWVPAVAGWRLRQYIRPGDSDPRFTRPADKIVNGRVRNKWVDQSSRLWVARKRLIKEVRGQLLLAWLHDRYPAVRLIVLLRHPCAVVESRLRLGWEPDLEDLLAQPRLVQDHLSDVASEMRAEQDAFSRHVWLWAAENAVALRQLAPGSACVVFYEDLLRAPRRELDRVLSWVGDAVTPQVITASLRPSARSRDKVTARTPEERLGAWREHVTPDQVARTVEILSRFGLDALYGEGEAPGVDADDVLGLF